MTEARSRDERIVHELRREHLDGNLALELALFGEEDARHPTASQFPNDSVLGAECVLQASAESRHDAPRCGGIGQQRT